MRTTYAAVKKIVEVDGTIVAQDTDLDPYIEAAGALVDDCCVKSGYNDTRLELIERWLSAHFYAVRDPRTRSESADGLSESYHGQTAMHLNFTSYGQQAMLLDTAGGLAALQGSMNTTKKGKVGIIWLGTKKGC